MEEEASRERDRAALVPPGGPEPVLLVTGFNPFEGYGRNPSGDIAERIDGALLAGVRVVGRRLDVSWKRGWPTLREAVEQARPDCVLALGVAPHPFIRLEVVAKNACLPDEDVDGERPSPGSMLCIIEGAPPAYWTTLPVDEMERRLRARGASDPWAPREGQAVPVTRWADAGTYLCNYVFFMAMHHLRDRVLRVGLVHVPPYRTEEAPRGIDEGELVEAVTAVLQEVAVLVAAARST